MCNSAWWKYYPKTESRQIKYPSLSDKSELMVGQKVYLIGKPEKIRKILKVNWHYHRYEYVYIIETSATNCFEPYWFSKQLQVIDQSI